jgi:hypothetical protein
MDVSRDALSRARRLPLGTGKRSLPEVARSIDASHWQTLLGRGTLVTKGPINDSRPFYFPFGGPAKITELYQLVPVEIHARPAEQHNFNRLLCGSVPLPV